MNLTENHNSGCLSYLITNKSLVTVVGLKVLHLVMQHPVLQGLQSLLLPAGDVPSKYSLKGPIPISARKKKDGNNRKMIRPLSSTLVFQFKKHEEKQERNKNSKIEERKLNFSQSAYFPVY